MLKGALANMTVNKTILEFQNKDQQNFYYGSLA